jgi:hypothetical protein
LIAIGFGYLLTLFQSLSIKVATVLLLPSVTLTILQDNILFGAAYDKTRYKKGELARADARSFP